MDLLKNISGNIDSAILAYPYEKLSPIRILEEVKLSEKRVITIQTDLVPFSKVGSKGASYLLIYSINDSSLPGHRLISGFPVNDGMFKYLLAEGSFGKNILITTHYNAYVEGLSGKSLAGSRHYEILHQ